MFHGGVPSKAALFPVQEPYGGGPRYSGEKGGATIVINGRLGINRAMEICDWKKNHPILVHELQVRTHKK